MATRTLCSLGLATTFALVLAACGGDDSTPTSPSPGNGGTGTIAATITITAAGAVDPKEVTVSAGSRVRFVNNHNVRHEMASDPHPSHTLCPELNSVGTLNPGQSGTSGNLNTPRVCTYHDHEHENDTALQGTIRVQ